MDASGALAATDITYSLTDYLAVGEMGFLLDARNHDTDAVLIDPLSLATSATFDIDGVTPAPADSFSYKWTMANDGSIYAASSVPIDSAPDWVLRSRVSRFTVPGSSAADRIYVDGFD